MARPEDGNNTIHQAHSSGTKPDDNHQLFQQHKLRFGKNEQKHEADWSL